MSFAYKDLNSFGIIVDFIMVEHTVSFIYNVCFNGLWVLMFRLDMDNASFIDSWRHIVLERFLFRSSRKEVFY